METAVATPVVSAPEPAAAAPASAATPTTETTSSLTPSTETTATRDESTLSGPQQLDFLRKELAQVPKDKFDAAMRGEEVTLDEKANKPAAEPAKPVTEQTPEQKAAAEKAAAEKAAAEARKTPEEKAAEEKAAAEKTAAEAAKSALDKLGPLPAEKIAKAFEDKPELEALLKPLGITKDDLMATARSAAVTSQFRQHFPTPEAAAYAKESAGHFYDIEEGFPSINSVETLDQFIMKTMLPLSILTDDQGQPLKNPDGTFQTDGSVARFFKFSGDLDMGMIAQQAAALEKAAQGDDEKEYAQSLAAAVAFINEYRNSGYKRPGAKTEAANLPEDVKARLAAADAEVEKARARDRETTAAAEKVTEDTIFNDTLKGVDSLVRETLTKTALSPALQKKAEKEIWQGIEEHLSNNREFQQLKRQYWSRGTADTKAIVALNINTIEGIFPSIAEKVLSEYGVDLVAANQSLHTKIDTQIARDRSTPSSATAATATTSKVLTADEIDQQAEANVLARHGGRRTPQFQQEFLSEVFKLTQAAAGAGA